MAEGARPLDVGRLVVDHHQVLYRYAYRLAGSAADAEDLTQQVFLIAQQKSDQVRRAECARGWLFAVLRNCYLKSKRQRTPLAAASVELDVDAIPEAPREKQIDSERLQAAIDALDDDFKIVILLFYFEHRTYREIAEVLEIPAGTVMSRLARAKAHLRQWLVDAAASELRRRDKSQAARPPFPELHGSSAGQR